LILNSHHKKLKNKKTRNDFLKTDLRISLSKHSIVDIWLSHSERLPLALFNEDNAIKQQQSMKEMRMSLEGSYMNV